MYAALAEFFEDAKSLHRTRDEQRFFYEGCKAELFLFDGGVQQILGVNDSQEIVKIAVADRKDGIRIFVDKAQVVFFRVVDIQPVHLETRRHQ